MNKKEVSEIKGLFKRDGGAIDRICGCLVDGERQIRMTFAESFVNLSQEEIDKYFEIFKKSLSGSLGKNLHTLEYTLDQELSGSGHKRLIALRQTKLKDESVLDEFYKSVSENYNYGESYYIVLIHCNYDVPGRGSDNLDMDDASEEVYEFVLCCICPVKLSEAGLCYNTQTNRVEERMRDQWIEAPVNAFLFPAFEERNTNIHSLLYYAKKTEELHEELIDGCIGGPAPMSFKTQKAVFQEIVEETIGEVCSYDTVCQIQENLTELIEEHKEEPQPLRLCKSDVKKLLQNSGIKEEKLENFESIYDETAGQDASFQAANLAETKSVAVKTPDVTIKVSPQRMDLIQIQLVDGRRCIVIPMEDGVQINGMSVTMEGTNGTDL